jgi:hypothetical protein
MSESLPATAAVRVSHVTFDPALYAEVLAADERTAEYLVPAIRGLPGFLHWYAGVSPDGSFVQVSVWDTEAHAAQMDTLHEMAVVARNEFRAVGVDFGPEYASRVNYPMTWHI